VLAKFGLQCGRQGADVAACVTRAWPKVKVKVKVKMEVRESWLCLLELGEGEVVQDCS
jgi:hypothetical protein